MDVLGGPRIFDLKNVRYCVRTMDKNGALIKARIIVVDRYGVLRKNWGIHGQCCFFGIHSYGR